MDWKKLLATTVAPAIAAIGISLAAVASPQAPDAASGLSWRLLGPFRGGWATMAVGVPSEPDVFYFAAAGGGVWKTVDAGRTWIPLFDHEPAASIGAIAVSPSDPKTLYVGTGQPEPRYDITAGVGVFKSIDGGKSWSSLGLADTRYIGSIWIDPHDPDLVLVGAEGHFFGPSDARGIYRSSDGGKTWTQPLRINNRTGVVDIASDPQNPRLIFASAWDAPQYPWQSYFTPVAGPRSGLYKSSDEGATWTKLSGGGWPQGPLGRIGIAVTRTAQGVRIYAAVDSKTAGGLWRSDDGGAHWARINKETAFTSWYASRLEAAPNDPNTIYTVGQSIRRCTNGGKTCEIFKGAPGGDDYHYVWINPIHPDHMITGSDQGAVVSVDGGATWSSWYNQPTGQFYHLATDNRFPYWIYSGQQDSGTVGIASRSDYGSISYRDWHPVGGDERDYDIPDPSDPSIVYGSGLGGRVSKWDARTGDVANISPWPESSYGKRPTTVRYHYLWVTPLVASLKGTPSLYFGAQVLFRSTDRGAHWSVISGDLTGKRAGAKNCNGDVSLDDAKSCGYGSISAIAPSPSDAKEIWVGTDDGLVQLTRDGGAHWNEITPKAISPWTKIAAIDLSALKDGTAIIAVDGHRRDDFDPHIFSTNDYGKSWTAIASNLPRGHFVDVVRSDPVRAGLLYAGTDAGAFVSFDDGGHWSTLGQGLPTAGVNDLLVHGNDLIAATQGRAIWVLDDITPLRDGAAQDADAHLFTPALAWRLHSRNNVDTPLPPETPMGKNPPEGAVIDYRLPKNMRGVVTLEIRDGSGKTVRRFASNDKPEKLPAEQYFAKAWLSPPEVLEASAGFHRFVWNLRWPRPPAIKFGYGISAVWGEGTPAEPQGAWVLPGRYSVVLTANGKTYSAPLAVAEDPRVRVSASDLQSSFDLSQQIAAVLAQAREGYGEEKAVQKQLDGVKDGSLHALVDRIRQKPAPGEPTFESVDSILTGTEGDLEAVDAAPTAAQRQAFAYAQAKLAEAQRRWDAIRKGPLAELDSALKKSGRKPVTIPPADALNFPLPETGQDLP
ncbi:MAG TPA: sialidase family protein [Rhizomicrobium sp.]|jgi:photosystem II stability/assembly factor-like uncharacterized protein|nr:sialidase family protein [Rhizomicrobium sp.]